ncbi:hypothetical protein FO440_03905 [Mucilaginibacter corticis]|uniref:Uncharacterized protein n=1 Tax=Mucilaginibacter corticis TaxID=2597670 RepID=A0A556MTY1_9SPHI|nr:hypothetical protein [Mucilaginibacter corticis]TSJ43347.1 hypothetical protein FO440_03905 [Mucilaginibacter corticis]
MENQPNLIPRIAITSIASGLILMAFFTTMWAGIASGSLHAMEKGIEIGFFGVLVIAFITFAIYFFSVAKRFPKISTEEDKAREKKEGKWFGIIFGAEGLGIFLGINIVVNLGHPDLTIPVIALVVGLHFYPMAKIFRRTMDYYVATWSTIIAICSIVLTLNKTMTPANIILFLGIGMALSTSCYGLYMIRTGRGYVKKTPIDVQAAVL